MEQTKLKAVAYVNWYTDMLPNNEKLVDMAVAEPIRLIFMHQFKNVDIEHFYIDVKGDFHQTQFAALLEACEQNKYDLVLIPSMDSLTPYASDFRSKIEQIKKASPFTEIYFWLEDFSTKNDDWELRATITFAFREQHSYEAKRKRELMKQMREIQSGQKG